MPRGNAVLVYLPRNRLIAAVRAGYQTFFYDDQTLELRAVIDQVVWSGDMGKLSSRERDGFQRSAQQFCRPGWLAESHDGKILLSEEIRLDGNGGYRLGVGELNLEECEVTFSELDRVNFLDTTWLDNPLQATSPCGCYALRYHWGSLRSCSTNIAGTATHRDCLPDDLVRFEISLDLWSRSFLRPLKTLEVMWLTTRSGEEEAQLLALSEHMQQNANPFAFGQSHDVRLSEDQKQALAAWYHRLYFPYLCWEPDSSGFWVFVGRTGFFRRVGLDGTISPFVMFERHDHWNDGRAGNGPENSCIRALEFGCPISTIDDKVEMEVWNERFSFPAELLDTRERVLAIPPDKDGFLDIRRQAPKMKDVVHLLTHQVNVRELSERGVQAALLDLAGLIERKFKDIVAGSDLSRTFELSFATPSGTLDEFTFFDLVEHEEWNIRAELVSVLNAWLEKCSGSTSIWGPTDPKDSNRHIGALGLALRHVVLADRTQSQLLRTYLARRDGEHENFSRDYVVPEYITSHGYFGDEAYRLVIYKVMTMYRDGLGLGDAAWNELGLLDAAEENLTPEMFAGFVTEEIREFDGAWQWNHQSTDGIRKLLSSALSARGTWGAKVLDSLDHSERRTVH